MAIITIDPSRDPMFTVHREGCRRLDIDRARGARFVSAEIDPADDYCAAVRAAVYPGDPSVSVRPEHVRLEPCL